MKQIKDICDRCGDDIKNPSLFFTLLELATIILIIITLVCNAYWIGQISNEKNTSELLKEHYECYAELEYFTNGKGYITESTITNKFNIATISGVDNAGFPIIVHISKIQGIKDE